MKTVETAGDKVATQFALASHTHTPTHTRTTVNGMLLMASKDNMAAFREFQEFVAESIKEMKVKIQMKIVIDLFLNPIERRQRLQQVAKNSSNNFAAICRYISIILDMPFI